MEDHVSPQANPPLPGLAVALRRAARRERPLHDDGLERRILRSVGAVRPEPVERRRGRLGRLRHRVAAAGVSLAVAAAAACLASLRPTGAVSRPTDAGSSPPAVEQVAIEQLPLPDELGEQLLAETAALAAEVVGLPRWNDLVAAGPIVATADTAP